MNPFDSHDGKPKSPAPLTTVSAAELSGRALPVREFLDSADLFPARNVVLLSGDGGLGKSLLAMQLALACSTSNQWIGIEVAPGPVVYLSAEEDEDETHMRLAEIAAAEGIDLAQAHTLHLIFLVGQDATLAVEGPGATLQPTLLFQRLDATLDWYNPMLVVIDNLADVFGGNEISRRQAKRFIGLLRGLALRHNCTILLPAHPSLSGRNSGTGESGSTAWHNSVRSRLYLTKTRDTNGSDEDLEVDPDQRYLTPKKANYSKLAEPIPLRWEDGRFVRSEAKSAYDGITVAHLEKVRDCFRGGAWRYDERSDEWGGYEVATIIGVDIGAPGVVAGDRTKEQEAGRRKVRSVLSGWIRNKQIRVVERPDRKRMPRKFFEAA